MEAIWPDKSIEQAMLNEAAIGELSHYTSTCNMACHIKALLCRVRELEADRQALLEDLKFVGEALEHEHNLSGSECGCGEDYVCVACTTANALEIVNRRLAAA